MGPKQKNTIEMLTSIAEDLNNSCIKYNGMDERVLLLLGDIAMSLAIMADESVKRNDMLIKLEGMNENEMEYVKSEKEKR